MNSLYIALGFFLASLLLQAAIVRLAARAVRLPKRTWGRAALVVAAHGVAGLALVAVTLPMDDEVGPIVPGLIVLVSGMVIMACLMKLAFGGRWKPSFAASGVHFGISCVAGIGLVMLLRNFITAYMVSSSAMSPSLRGYHVVEVLPDGNHLIVAANEPNDRPAMWPGEPTTGIVAETFEQRETKVPVIYTHTADRFVCNKTKFPSRGDATVFRHPENPALIHVKRLVGLPGERLRIHGGKLTIDGNPIDPATKLGRIPYGSRGEVLTGEAEPEPFEVVLGPGEYWLMGDNTQNSADSRYFGPVNRESIIGVADLIYWPPGRWKMDP